AHGQAPRIIRERLRCRTGERRAGACCGSARKQDAASEQSAAIKQAIAGDIRHLRFESCLPVGHQYPPSRYEQPVERLRPVPWKLIAFPRAWGDLGRAPAKMRHSSATVRANPGGRAAGIVSGEFLDACFTILQPEFPG